MNKKTKQTDFVNNYFNKNTGYFVDIGASDGINGSNSYYFESIGWKGICIEPIPEIYNLLIKNRSCECYNVAITDENKEYDFTYVKGNRRPGIYIDMLSGLNDYYNDYQLNRIDDEIKRYKGELVELKVEGVTFNSLVKEINIDYVSIDTEGNENSIIKSIDFNKYNIKVLSIENNFKDDLVDVMKLRGYEHTTNIGPDKIFIKK